MARKTQEQLVLDTICQFYGQSGDFNGLPLRSEDSALLAPAVRLVRKGLVEVITGEDYMNPHIRPWHTASSPEDQIAALRKAASGDGLAVLYPTALALADLDASMYSNEPFTRRMALGGTTLQLAFFETAALEAYREDPRFHFQCRDFGVSFDVTSEVYLDPSEAERDKVSLDAGFAYRIEDLESPAFDRRVCAFLCDLKQLTPEIQQRWRTFEVDNAELSPHPMWWRMQMGHFPDGPGPFERFSVSLKRSMVCSSKCSVRTFFDPRKDPESTVGYSVRRCLSMSGLSCRRMHCYLTTLSRPRLTILRYGRPARTALP